MDAGPQLRLLPIATSIPDNCPNLHFSFLLIDVRNRVNLDALDEYLGRHQQVDGTNDASIVGPVVGFHPGKDGLRVGIVEHVPAAY